MKLIPLGINGPYPEKTGACSGYLLQGTDANILIDCGTGVLARMLRFVTIDKLSGVILTHLHYDHMSDMLPMQYLLQFAHLPMPIKVIAPEKPANVRSMLACQYFDLYAPQDFRFGDLRVSFCEARHPVEAVSVKVTDGKNTFVYTGDTNTNDVIEMFAYEADLLLADAGLPASEWKSASPHLSGELCGMLAADTNVKKLLLTHIRPGVDTEMLLGEALAHFSDTEIAVAGRTYII